MLTQKSFYLIRHGQTNYNLQGLNSGAKNDLPLNETGKAQALSLKKTLEGRRFKQVICSPMQRARDTAKIAFVQEPIIEPDIREWDVGDFSGKPVEEFNTYVEQISAEAPLPNGESQACFFGRVVKSINKSLEMHGEDILFVCHGGVHWALTKILKLPEYDLENAKLVYFKNNPDGSWEHIIP